MRAYTHFQNDISRRGPKSVEIVPKEKQQILNATVSGIKHRGYALLEQ
jgi:hypothetical protein